MLATYSGVFSRPSILNGTHARGDQLGNQSIGRQILRAEQILLLAQVDVAAVANQLIGQSAGLRALAAVGTATAQRFAGQALTRIGHAQRAVDEHLQRHRRAPGDCGDLVDRQLAGQHHALDPQLLGQADRLGTGHRHLRRGVNRQVGTDRANQPRQAQVLHQHGVDAGRGDAPHELLDLGQLAGKHQRVERHVGLHLRPCSKAISSSSVSSEMFVARARALKPASSPK